MLKRLKQFRKINTELMLAYYRQLGLAAMVGCLSGLFLKPHHRISLISLIILLLIGVVFSYYGISERRY